MFCFSVIEYSHAAFQCYKCNNCGSMWNPSKVAMALTENGGNYCTVSFPIALFVFDEFFVQSLETSRWKYGD